MAGTTTVILGGGTGGLTAANELRQRLGPEHRVVLIERRATHLFAPSLLWLMVGERRREQLSKDLRRMVRPGVEVVQAEVEELDPGRGRVVAGGRAFDYDALLIALGADLAPDALPGYAAAAYDFFDLDGADRLRGALQSFAGGKIVVAVTALPFKCPAAPYEAALLIDDLLRRRGIRQRSEMVVVTPEPQPMPVAGPALGQAVSGLLAQRGIGFLPNRPLQTIDPDRRELIFGGGTREPFDLLAAVPPHRSPHVVATSPLANESGWIPVDRRTLRTTYDRVYALGDVAGVTLANGRPLPKAGVFAHAEALAVARTLVAELLGGQPATFDGTGYCWVELGGDQAAFASGDFYAEPAPAVALRRPGRSWHVGKILFERYWMGNRLERSVAGWGLTLGSKVLGVPAAL